MRVIAFSDTHSYHRQVKIPEGDLLICAGDITFRGELPIIEDFCNWMKEQPHKHKVCIFGNHELFTQNGRGREPALNMVRDAGIIHLENSMVEIEGLKLWGSPFTPFYNDWEYNVQRGKDIAAIWAKIPDNVDIICTHGPPYKILDKAPRGEGKYSHEGCKDLLARAKRLPKLKLSIFGHLHRDFSEPPVEKYGVIFANASILNNKYEVANDPIVIDI